MLPNLWAATLGDVVMQRRNERGGHFAAWEQPEALVADLWALFGRDGAAFACVSGLDGFVRKGS